MRKLKKEFTTLSTDEWPSATKLISIEKVNLECDSSK